MEEKYKITVWCNNCGLQQELEINVGMTVNDFINYKHPRCKKCGCDTLNKIKYNN